MPRRILIGEKDFSKFRKDDNFYIDKTGFIREWWDPKENVSVVSLILRPPRFGKTLL